MGKCTSRIFRIDLYNLKYDLIWSVYTLPSFCNPPGNMRWLILAYLRVQRHIRNVSRMCPECIARECMAISDFRVGSRRRRHGLIEVSLGPSLPWDGRAETGELFSPLQGAYVPQQELRVHGSLRSHKDAYTLFSFTPCFHAKAPNRKREPTLLPLDAQVYPGQHIWSWPRLPICPLDIHRQ